MLKFLERFVTGDQSMPCRPLLAVIKLSALLESRDVFAVCLDWDRPLAAENTFEWAVVSDLDASERDQLRMLPDRIVLCSSASSGEDKKPRL